MPQPVRTVVLALGAGHLLEGELRAAEPTPRSRPGR